MYRCIQKTYLQENMSRTAPLHLFTNPASIPWTKLDAGRCPKRRISLARAGASLLGLAATSTTSVHLALGLRISADVLEGSSVPVVAVNTSQLTTVDRGHALDVDVALALLGALGSCKRMFNNLISMIGITYVSARAVELAVIVDIEVDDVHSSTSVVLNDFVGCVVGAATDDPGLLSSLVFFDGNGILANIFEPNELKSAVALAMHTFRLNMS
jgi:hypothetical protein